MYHQTTWKNSWLLCHEKHLQFFDRFQSMSSSIDKLASNLPDEAYTSKVFKSETFKLMKQKGVYPHDYMSSFDKFNKKQLVTKDEFYSILSDEHISDDQYDMYKMFGTHLTLRQWEIIMIFINLIHAIILQVLDCLGMIQYVKNDRYKIRLS